MPIATKEVKGKAYLYFSRMVNGKKKEEYCGPAKDSDSLRKAKMRERSYIEEQIESLQKELARLADKVTGPKNPTSQEFTRRVETEVSAFEESEAGSHVAIPRNVMEALGWPHALTFVVKKGRVEVNGAKTESAY